MRQVFRLALAAVCACAMAGCGGGSSTSNTTTSNPSSANNGTSFPAQTYDYVTYAVTNLPQHLRVPPVSDADNTPADNPITNAGANLGRVVFYDKHLSSDDTVACASCHQQAHGFSDPAKFSSGVNGGVTTRHAMGLTNARFYQPGKFFWDERALNLKAQIIAPIQAPNEMNVEMTALATKLSALNYYPPLFQNAFGSRDITPDRISSALAQFVQSMVSYGSKYDRAVIAGAPGQPNLQTVFTPQEAHGAQIFRNSGCPQCHGTDAQISAGVQNNGLDAVTTDVGAGQGRMKSPSLRNVAVRGPYMHDGRFATLDEVIEFYNSGVQDSPDLSPLMRVGGLATWPVRRLNLTAQDKADLKAFLETLTDNQFLTDPKFASPF